MLSFLGSRVMAPTSAPLRGAPLPKARMPLQLHAAGARLHSTMGTPGAPTAASLRRRLASPAISSGRGAVRAVLGECGGIACHSSRLAPWRLCGGAAMSHGTSNAAAGRNGMARAARSSKALWRQSTTASVNRRLRRCVATSAKPEEPAADASSASTPIGSAADAAGAGAHVHATHPPGGTLLVAEAALMERLQMKSVRSFRIGLATVVGVTGLTLFLFWEDVLGWSAEQTADVATRSLEDENVQRQVHDLAKSVVDQVLTDEKIFAQATAFTGNIVTSEATKEQLVAVVKATLRDPAVMADVQQLTNRVAVALLNDPPTLRTVVELLRKTLEDPTTKATFIAILKDVFATPEIRTSASELASSVLADPATQAQAKEAMIDVVHSVLDDQQVQTHATAFFKQVLGDEALHQMGGDALWSAFSYALTPSWSPQRGKGAGGGGGAKNGGGGAGGGGAAAAGANVNAGASSGGGGGSGGGGALGDGDSGGTSAGNDSSGARGSPGGEEGRSYDADVDDEANVHPVASARAGDPRQRERPAGRRTVVLTSNSPPLSDAERARARQVLEQHGELPSQTPSGASGSGAASSAAATPAGAPAGASGSGLP